MKKKALSRIICMVLAIAITATIVITASAAKVGFTPSQNGLSVSMVTTRGIQILPGMRIVGNTTGNSTSNYDLSGEIINGSANFSWPLPGHYYVSSLFGGRIHPITGKADNHGGVDIPATYNTQILAADSGTVIVSGWDNSYGNYVKIRHANGMYTLYAHMASRNCTVGQYVEKGQVIGFVDSTGSSTGNHLHFEIHNENDTKVDPVSYFPGLLYVESGSNRQYLY